jgi:hypothetical protein
LSYRPLCFCVGREMLNADWFLRQLTANQISVLTDEKSVNIYSFIFYTIILLQLFQQNHKINA